MIIDTASPEFVQWLKISQTLITIVLVTMIIRYISAYRKEVADKHVEYAKDLLNSAYAADTACDRQHYIGRLLAHIYHTSSRLSKSRYEDIVYQVELARCRQLKSERTE